MDIAGRIAKLSRREKAISALTLFVVLVVAPYSLVYSPAREEIASRRQELQNLSDEITSLASSLKETVGGQTSDVPVITLPEASDLAGIIEAISLEADLTGVDFTSVSQEGFSRNGQYLQVMLKLEIRARYRQFYDFVRTISDKHRLFMIQSMRYETNEAIYPSGVGIIRAVAYLERK